jgi:hypothetical protein
MLCWRSGLVDDAARFSGCEWPRIDRRLDAQSAQAVWTARREFGNVRRVRIALFFNAGVAGSVTGAGGERVIGRWNWPRDLCA